MDLRAPLFAALSLVAAACAAPGSGDDGGTDDATGASTGSGPTSDGGPTSGAPGTDAGSDGATTAVDGTADATGTDPTTTGASACPPTHECLPVAPEGWVGPVAFETGDILDDVVACGGDFDAELLAAMVDPTALPPECTCVCDANATCDDIVVERCSFPNVFWVAPGGMCENDTSSNASGVWSAESELTGTCDPNATTIADPPSFTAAIRACGATPLDAACEADHACVPLPTTPLSGQLCIFGGGDIECPNDEFALRTVYMRDFEDTRVCTECTCGSPPALCDIPGGITIFENANCSIAGGTVNIEVADGTCDPLTSGGTGIATPGSWFAPAPEVPADACTADGGMPDGEFLPTDPVTVCCRL